MSSLYTWTKASYRNLASPQAFTIVMKTPAQRRGGGKVYYKKQA